MILEPILFEDNVCGIGISICEKPIHSADCKYYVVTVVDNNSCLGVTVFTEKD